MASRPAPAPAVQGAGATFPAPLYQRWFTHLLVREGLLIGYEAIGSGEGEDQLDQGLVDFAGSDRSAFNGTQTSLTTGRWLRIPMVAGAIAVAYNNPDCRLRLSRDQLRQVFAGEIKTFKALGCADRPIHLLVRSRRSGTTANLRHYLGSTQEVWHDRVAQRVNSNEEMATALMQQPGSLGYLETVFLYGRGRLQTAALEVSQGQFLRPEPALVRRALNRQGDGYPLSVVNELLMPRVGLGPKAEVLRAAISYGLSKEGQAEAQGLGYEPLPEGLLQRSMTQLKELKP